MKRREIRSVRYLFILLIAVTGFRFAMVDWQERKRYAQLQSIVEVVDFADITDTLSTDLTVRPTKEMTTVAEEEKTIVQSKPSKPTQPKKQWSSKMSIDINKADSMQWTSLYGIGPVLSGRIVKFRDKLGGFHSIDQLEDVYGLSPETYQKIRSQLICRGDFKTIELEQATFKELLRHPYLQYEEVKGVKNFLRKVGAIQSVDDLISATGKSVEQANKFWPYVELTQTNLIVSTD